MSSIRELIRQIVIDEFTEMYGVPCVVESVDEDEGTCACLPVNGDAKFIDVRLQAEAGKGVLIMPKVGSKVIVQPINTVTGYVSMFSDVDSIKFLDGSHGGLVKISDLVTKLNNLEDTVNDLISTLQGIVIPLAPSGTYPFAPEFAGIAPLTPTEVGELENDKITHGDI